MITKTINNGLTDLTVVVAEEGKVLRRKNTDDVLGEEVVLGYVHYINGVKLDEPVMSTPEDFEEIDKPEEEEMI